MTRFAEVFLDAGEHHGDGKALLFFTDLCGDEVEVGDRLAVFDEFFRGLGAVGGFEGFAADADEVRLAGEVTEVAAAAVFVGQAVFLAVEVVEARGEDGVARVEVAVDEAHRAELDVVADVGGAVGLADDGFADGEVFQLLFGRDVPAAQVAAAFGRHGEVADGRRFPFAAKKRRVVFVVVGDELVGDGFVDVHRARFRLFQ